LVFLYLKSFAIGSLRRLCIELEKKQVPSNVLMLGMFDGLVTCV